MQIDAGWARWGDTEGGRRGRMQEPWKRILIGTAEQAQFNAVSVVACGIANMQYILQSIAVAFRGAAQQRCWLAGLFCEASRLMLFFALSRVALAMCDDERCSWE